MAVIVGRALVGGGVGWWDEGRGRGGVEIREAEEKKQDPSFHIFKPVTCIIKTSTIHRGLLRSTTPLLLFI